MGALSLKEKILEYAGEQYGTDPEYLWAKFPEFAVLRRGDNKKWYAILMDVPRCKLGLSGDSPVPIMNLKCGELLMDSLRKEKGILPAYHMNKENWISVLLDGTVPESRVFSLVDLSYQVVAGGKKKRAI